jgi:hypothetical protein
LDLWWECPKCKERVNFSEQAKEVFNYEDGEANFVVDKGGGLYFHIIQCNCGAEWIFSISGMYDKR